MRTTAADLIPAAITDKQDWCFPIIQKLKQPPSTMVGRALKDFTIVNDELYHQGSGTIARALTVAEVREEIQRVTNFHSRTLTLTYADACKDKDTTGMRSSKRLPSYNLLVRNARNP